MSFSDILFFVVLVPGIFRVVNLRSISVFLDYNHSVSSSQVISENQEIRFTNSFIEALRSLNSSATPTEIIVQSELVCEGTGRDEEIHVISESTIRSEDPNSNGIYLNQFVSLKIENNGYLTIEFLKFFAEYQDSGISFEVGSNSSLLLKV